MNGAGRAVVCDNVERLMRRLVLAGLGVLIATGCSFNPQPDPPVEASDVGGTGGGATTTNTDTSAGTGAGDGGIDDAGGGGGQGSAGGGGQGGAGGASGG